MNISSKELKKMARNQLSGKYGTFIGTNVLYILITLVASNLMDLVLGTSSVLNPLTATSATVETLGISHTVVYYLSTFILSLILSVLNIGLLKIEAMPSAFRIFSTVSNTIRTVRSWRRV